MTNAIEKPEGGELKNHGSAARHRPDRREGDAAQPGDLQGTTTLVIQTRQAQRLLKGRPGRRRQAGIPGLYPFSARMGAIWMAARRDDPYADWYLVQISKRIEETRIELGHLRQPLEERLHNVTGIEVRDHIGTHIPVRRPEMQRYVRGRCRSGDLDFDSSDIVQTFLKWLPQVAGNVLFLLSTDFKQAHQTHSGSQIIR